MLPLDDLAQLAAAAASAAPLQAEALRASLARSDPDPAAAARAVLRALAQARMELLAADSMEAADLWYALAEATAAMRSPFMDALSRSASTSGETIARQLVGAERASTGQQKSALAGPDLLIGAAGDFKRGKSTVLNALLGAAILPMRAAPATAVPIFLRYAPIETASIHYRDDRAPVIVSIAEGARASSIALPLSDGEQSQDREIARVEIGIPSPFLEGATLVDLPGLNEEAERAETAAAVLETADVVLVVLAATQLLAEDEIEWIDGLWRHGHRTLIFVVNYRDRVDAGDIDALRERAARILAPYSGVFGATIFLISAREALQERTSTASGDRGGIRELEARLHRLLLVQREEVLRLSRARQALDALEREERLAGEAVVEAQDMRRRIRGEILAQDEQQAILERAHAVARTDAEEALGDALHDLADHDARFDAGWETLEADLRDRCERESLPWVWQEARAWLRGALADAIRTVYPTVSPRPEGHLRIHMPPGLRVGREALLAFYRDEAAREWDRFTAAARRRERATLEEHVLARREARATLQREQERAVATLIQRQTVLHAAAQAAAEQVAGALQRAEAAARDLIEALREGEFPERA